MLDVGCWALGAGRWALGVDYLVDDNMGHTTERRVLLQHPQQHACCHEEQRGGRALLERSRQRASLADLVGPQKTIPYTLDRNLARPREVTHQRRTAVLSGDLCDLCYCRCRTLGRLQVPFLLSYSSFCLFIINFLVGKMMKSNIYIASLITIFYNSCLSKNHLF